MVVHLSLPNRVRPSPTQLTPGEVSDPTPTSRPERWTGNDHTHPNPVSQKSQRPDLIHSITDLQKKNTPTGQDPETDFSRRKQHKRKPDTDNHNDWTGEEFVSQTVYTPISLESLSGNTVKNQSSKDGRRETENQNQQTTHCRSWKSTQVVLLIPFYEEVEGSSSQKC